MSKNYRRCGGAAVTEGPQPQMRYLPVGAELLHIRNFTEQDGVIGPSGYPSWYFQKPTFFLVAPGIPGNVYDIIKNRPDRFWLPDAAMQDEFKRNVERKIDMEGVLNWRKSTETKNLIHNYFSAEPLPSALSPSERELVQKRDFQIANDIATYNVERLYVDRFRLRRPTELLFFDEKTYSLRNYYDLIQKADSSFERPKDTPAGPDQLPAADWFFKNDSKHGSGWIQLPVNPTDPNFASEVMLTNQALPNLDYLGAQPVSRWLDPNPKHL